jgi:hypothetical protein
MKIQLAKQARKNISAPCNPVRKLKFCKVMALSTLVVKGTVTLKHAYS